MKDWIKSIKLFVKQPIEKFYNWYDNLDLFNKKREKRFYELLFRPSVKALILMNLLHHHYVVEGDWSEEEFQCRVAFRPNSELILVDGKPYNYPKSIRDDYSIIMGYNRSEESRKRFEYLVDNLCK